MGWKLRAMLWVIFITLILASIGLWLGENIGRKVKLLRYFGFWLPAHSVCGSERIMEMKWNFFCASLDWLWLLKGCLISPFRKRWNSGLKKLLPHPKTLCADSGLCSWYSGYVWSILEEPEPDKPEITNYKHHLILKLRQINSKLQYQNLK